MEWLDPWYGIEPPERDRLESALKLELCSGHLLFGVPVTALGRRKDRDDVLFRLDDGTERIAVVHLTWASGPGSDPRWPSTRIYEDIGVWEATCMSLQNDAWRCDGSHQDDD